MLNYELLLLMPAVGDPLRAGIAAGLPSGELLIYVTLWLIPTLGMVLNREGLPLMALVVVLFAVLAWVRLQSAAKVELPIVSSAR